MAKKIANTKGMPKEEWLELRRHSIGGSDAGSVLGLNPWASAITVYLDKTGKSKDKETSEAMRLGSDMEKYVAERWMEETGKKVRRDNYMYAHDDYAFITANIDFDVIGENAGLETKTMGSFSDYDLEGGEVPAHYYAQCQHYMFVKGYDRMYMAVLVFQRGVYCLTIERNDEFIKDMVEQECDFWHNFVEAKEMPAPDGSEATDEALKELWPSSNGTEIVDPTLDKDIKEYREFGEAIKRLKEQQNEVKERIVIKLQEAEKGTGSDFYCTYKSSTRTSIDTKRLQKELPEIYNHYKKDSVTRTLRTNKVKRTA